MEKDARNKGAESTDNNDPETEKPLKVGNIYRFLKVKVIEKYKVTDKEYHYVTDLAKTINVFHPLIPCKY